MSKKIINTNYILSTVPKSNKKPMASLSFHFGENTLRSKYYWILSRNYFT